MLQLPPRGRESPAQVCSLLQLTLVTAPREASRIVNAWLRIDLSYNEQFSIPTYSTDVFCCKLSVSDIR